MMSWPASRRLHRLLLVGLLVTATGPALLDPSATRAQGSPRIGLAAVIAGGLDDPLYVTHAGDGSGRLFLVEQKGRIWVIENGRRLGRPFLDISSRVIAPSQSEQGLLGLAFHPGYATNRRFFVNYTRVPDGATVVAEYRASGDPALAERGERVVLQVPQPHSTHNGGMIEFGPDGYLYVALGDGGPLGDPRNRAQNLDELLGKILRIDVDGGTPYAIPPDNPFIGGGRPEIYAVGFRNPFRFSFDRKTGDLFVGDVGEHRVEEIDLVLPGRNYGWSIMEGSLCFRPANCSLEGLEPPIAEYPRPVEHGLRRRGDAGETADRARTLFHHPQRGGQRCAVIGGYSYRGAAIPDLQGMLVFGDLCSGEIFGLSGDGEGIRVLLKTGFFISSFGQDEAGELYILGLGGSLHRIVPR